MVGEASSYSFSPGVPQEPSQNIPQDSSQTVQQDSTQNQQQAPQVQQAPQPLSESQFSLDAKPFEVKKGGAGILVGVVLVIVIIAIGGFFILGGQKSPIELAKNSPQVKEFLDAHPVATSSISTYSNLEFQADYNFWKNSCSKDTNINEYYLLKVEDTNETYKALFDKKDLNFICGIVQNKSAVSDSSSDTQNTETISPKEVYLGYREKFDQLNNFADYRRLVMEYASQEILQNIPKDDNRPQVETDAIFSGIKALAPKLNDINIQSIKEQINDSNATLNVTTKNEASSAIVVMIKENNIWKIFQENWSINNKQDSNKSADKNICNPNWVCESWGNCNNGIQLRSCTDVNHCGVIINAPQLTQACTVTCAENWSCSDWGTCSSNLQSRTCNDLNNCSTILNKPPTTQSCTSTPYCGDGVCDGIENYSACPNDCPLNYPLQCTNMITFLYQGNIYWVKFHVTSGTTDPIIIQNNCGTANLIESSLYCNPMAGQSNEPPFQSNCGYQCENVTQSITVHPTISQNGGDSVNCPTGEIG